MTQNYIRQAKLLPFETKPIDAASPNIAYDIAFFRTFTSENHQIIVRINKQRGKSSGLIICR